MNYVYVMCKYSHKVNFIFLHIYYIRKYKKSSTLWLITQNADSLKLIRLD